MKIIKEIQLLSLSIVPRDDGFPGTVLTVDGMVLDFEEVEDLN